MLETAQFIRAEAAGLFHVPVTMLGDVDKGKANAEQLAVNICLTVWNRGSKQCVRSSNANYSRVQTFLAWVAGPPRTTSLSTLIPTSCCVRPPQIGKLFTATGFNTGSLCPNDIREMEGKNPREDAAGETYLCSGQRSRFERIQLWCRAIPPRATMTRMRILPPDPETNSLSRIYSGLFRDAFGRALSRDKADPKIFQPIMYAIADQLCLNHDPDWRNVRDPHSW